MSFYQSMLTTDIDAMTKEDTVAKLLVDAAKLKCCRNCALCYIREDEEKGQCKRTALNVGEYFVCDHWQPKKKKETDNNDPGL